MVAPRDPRQTTNTTTVQGTGLTNVPEEQDFSPVAASRRELAKQLDYSDTMRELSKKYSRGNEPAPRNPLNPYDSTPGAYNALGVQTSIPEQQPSYYLQLMAQVRANEMQRRAKTDLAKFPIMRDIVDQAALAGQELSTEDIQNLVDFGVLNDAADTIIAGIDPRVGDPNVANNVMKTLSQTNPVAAAFLPDIVEEKLKAAITDPNVLQQVARSTGEILNTALTPFIAAWEWTAEGVEAGNYAAANSGRSEFTWPNQIAGFFSPSDRAAIAPGKLNENYIQELRDARNPDGSPVYTPLQIEIVTELVRRRSRGDAYPIADLWTEKYAGNLEAIPIFGDLVYNRSTGNTQELYRQVESANLSNLGDSMLGAALDVPYSEFRGSELRSNLSDAAYLVTGLAIDPTNALFGAGRALQAARWSLARLAPGVGEADQVLRSMRLGTKALGFEFNPAYRYFDNFTKDLNKYDDIRVAARDALQAGDTKKATRLRGNAADLRTRMARQYDEMPENLIDDFYKNMPRNREGKFDTQTAAAWIDESNNAYLTTLGQVAPKMDQIAADDAVKRATLTQILATETDPVKLRKANTELASLDAETAALLKPLQQEINQAQSGTLYSQVGRTTQRSEPLVPRMGSLARLRKDAVNSIRVSQMSSRAVDKMIGKYLPNLEDPAVFADDLSRNAEALGFDVRGFRAGMDANPIAGTTDSIARMLSSLPDVRLVNIQDASSTKVVYRLARAFFPRRMARMMADQWRAGTPGSRRKMINGIVRSAAAVRGVTLTDDALSAFMRGVPTVNDLATGTMLGERYAVMVPDGILPSQRAAGVAQGPGAPVSLSADANGIEHALHLSDTADYVRIPSMKQFEELRKEMGLAMQGYYWAGRGAEHTTNLMSFLTLYGLRFSLRNAIEENLLFLAMGGSPGTLVKGRAMDQAVRRATPRAVVRLKDGKPEVQWKSSLGMFANKLEWASRWLESKGAPAWLNEFVYSAVDARAAEAALAAKKAGDPDAYVNLVLEAVYARKIGPKGFSLLGADDRKILRYFAESSHGQALYDEVAGGADYLQNAAMPNFAADVDMIDGAIPGVTLARMPNPNRLTIEGYENLPPIQVNPATGARIFGVTAWWRQIEKTLVGDGPIGEAAVRGLTDPAKAKAEIAQIIRDDVDFQYKERFSRITDDMSIDEFANAYFENVFQHFTMADGTLNTALRSQFMEFNPATGLDEATFWRPVPGTTDEFTARVSMTDLEDIPVNERPLFVFGPKLVEETRVPIAETEAALLTPTRGYGWMGRQNARISRGPIFDANLMTAWRQTLPARKAMAESLARGAGRSVPSADDVLLAEKLYAKDAMDQAYSMSISYLDNPANRSNLAWKARNVSRYYRATEDFWRRMKRTAANRPEAFWRIALTYQLLTDTGFVYQDDEGTAYFGYPGNEQLNQAIASASTLFGLAAPMKFMDTNPFFVAGKLSGMTPSTDPMQQLPSAFGVGAVAMTGIYSAFPALYKLKGLQKLTLGQYANVTGDPLADMLGAAIPPLVERVQGITDPEQFDASVGQAAMDTLAIMSAEGLLDTVTIAGKKIPSESIQSAAQFRQSEEYIAAQRIGVANFITRLFFQTAGPAAPQQYSNTVSKVARDLGVMGMKPLFRTLLDSYADAPDPFAAAYSEFVAAQTKRMKNGEEVGVVDFLPFTMSTYKSPTGTPDQAQAALAKVRAGTDAWLEWFESDEVRDLQKNGYYLPSLFLAPRNGEFDWASWAVAKNDLGLKVKKEDDEKIMDLLALNGEHTDSLIRASYDELIAAQDPNTDAGREAISALTEARDLDRQSNKVLNPAWDVVDGQRFGAYTDANYRALFGGMRNMLSYMRERDGELTGTAQAIDNAVNIYLYYQQQLAGVSGPGPQREAAKKGIKAQMDAELAVMKQMDENAAVFIESVIDNLSYKPQYPAFGEG